MKRILLFILPVLFMFNSCKKYPDGPAISLNTKKHRIANSWVLDKVLESGIDQTAAYKNMYQNYNLVTNHNDTYTLTFTNNSNPYSESGTWRFDNDKSRFLIFNSVASSSSALGNSWAIYKLKEKEFWIKSTDGNGTAIEIHLMPK